LFLRRWRKCSGSRDLAREEKPTPRKRHNTFGRSSNLDCVTNRLPHLRKTAPRGRLNQRQRKAAFQPPIPANPVSKSEPPESPNQKIADLFPVAGAVWMPPPWRLGGSPRNRRAWGGHTGAVVLVAVLAHRVSYRDTGTNPGVPGVKHPGCKLL
jgi:hypothetical protein